MSSRSEWLPDDSKVRLPGKTTCPAGIRRLWLFAGLALVCLISIVAGAGIALSVQDPTVNITVMPSSLPTGTIVPSAPGTAVLANQTQGTIFPNATIPTLPAVQAQAVVVPTDTVTAQPSPVRDRTANNQLEQAFVNRGVMRMRTITDDQRREAAVRIYSSRNANAASTPGKSSAGISSVSSLAGSNGISLPGRVITALPGPGGIPDYFGTTPNWAYSPAPVMNTTTGAITGGMRKFVDSLPGLGAGNPNNLGKYIPVAVADTSMYPGSDYYEIGLVQFVEKMHSDLPPTTLRGYVQLSTANVTGTHTQLFYPNGTPIRDYQGNLVYGADIPRYLGPTIIAQKDRPVRVKFTNYLPTGTGGDLFIPMDSTAMGAGVGPDNVSVYAENRATLHLHGGATPWISDGTPHQWTTPVGENTAYPKGVSVQNVPDMDGGYAPPGTLTFFYTNQQSARLMFYHDHAYGITRLNVYVGEAAGYLVQDSAEAGLVAAGVIPATQIPLIIQDKAFVDNTTIRQQDPTWNWGTGNPSSTAMTGDLWFPHVYMPNQNPGDLAGINAMGRWDYGPWFWPPFTGIANGPLPNPLYDPVNAPWENIVNPGTPNPSMVPESFVDTPLVNGNAYPYLKVGENTYRFRILNAANDRTLNLQLYYASTPGPIVAIVGGTGTGASATATVNASGSITGFTVTSGGAGYNSATPPTVKVFDAPGHTPKGTGAAATVDIDDSSGTLQFINVAAAGSGYAVPTVCKGPGAPSPSVCTEVSMIPANPRHYPSGWPTADGRTGGWPDPANVGPSMIQIGTEGGFLPVPVVIQNRPMGYDYNRRSITVLNVLEKALFIGPAERADVIVDFSGVPTGSTLILYNDAPAPVPAFDPRNDYYTNGPDNTLSGGAPSTLPGYGPNTRTVMQIQVNATQGVSPAYNLAALQAQLPAAYAINQPPPIVPVNVYDSAFGANFPQDPYVRIQQTSITFTPTDSLTPVTMSLQPKAIQELFSPDYGRMNSLLGLELPLTTMLTQTTIPYGYVDPPTEVFNMTDIGTPIGARADGTQIWKITHNGVDTHAVHFHMFNVQVLNRVGWDGQVKPPNANEIGWKDTVNMNPLEDCIVAARPIKMTLPESWGDLPNSVRALDVTRPLNTSMGQFLNSGPDGKPTKIINHLVNFGAEYVWHCHLLGHEENDMMRTMAFAYTPTSAPSGLIAGNVTVGGKKSVYIQWQDTTEGESHFTIQRATNAAGPWTQIARPASLTGPQSGNWVLYRDPTVTNNAVYYYRVIATNIVGDSTIYAGSTGYPWIAVNSSPSNTAVPINNAPLPTVAFNGSPTLGAAPMTVQFIDQSAGSPGEWLWSFGDGSTSALQDPSHTYTLPGNYTVSLTATTIGGSRTLTKTNYISVFSGLPPAPVANFVGTPVNGTMPMTVVFRDQSLNSPNQWSWNFGDGNAMNATSQNPVHTYNAVGTFTVSLNATNPYGTGRITKVAYINVGSPPLPPPVVSSMSPPTGFQNSTVSFTIGGNYFRPGFTTVAFRNATGAYLGTTTLTSTTATQITGTIPIPANAWMGPYNIYVTTAGSGTGTGTGLFSVIPRTIPTITSITPAQGFRNTTVNYVIAGTNFTAGQTSVEFRNATGSVLSPAGVTSYTATQISGRLVIPANAWLGLYNVNVTTPGTSAPGTGLFTVAQTPAPTITSIAPATGYRNNTVTYTITGTNFAPGMTTVTFRNATGSVLNPPGVTSVTATQIKGTIAVPANAWIGPYDVGVTTVNGGTTTGTGLFTVAQPVPPTITSTIWSTAWRNTTSTFTLTGTNFAPGQTTVTFQNAAGGILNRATLTSVTATAISGRILVPANAVVGSYYVTVTTPGGPVNTPSPMLVSVYPAPRISTVTPVTATRGTTPAFSISGLYFEPGLTTSSLTRAGSPDILLDVNSATKVLVKGTAPIPGAATPGPWNVVVRTIDGGMVTLPNAVTLV